MVFIKQLRQLIGALCFTMLILSSCDQGTDVEIANQEANPAFDSVLTEVFYLMEDSPMPALEKLDNLISEAESINSKYYSGRAKWFKGYIYDDIVEDLSQAYLNYNEALQDILQTDDSSLKRNIYNNLGILYKIYGQYDAAITMYESALELKDELTETDLSDFYYNYGVALNKKGDSISFYRAGQALTKSLEYAQQIEYHENIASVYNLRGLMFKDRKNYEKARLEYDNTIRTYIDNPDLQNTVGMAYHGIGVTYMLEQNTEASIRAFEKALEYKRESRSIFVTKLDLGTVLLRDGRMDDAIAVWKDALNEKYNKHNKEHVQIYSELASVLKKNSQFEEALGYSGIYASHMKDILNESENYKIKGDQVLFESAVNEYQNRLAVNQMQLDRKSLQTNFLMATVMGTVIFSGFIFKYYRRQKNLSQHLAAVGQIAKLKALKAQINPHFLFNALNSIQSFILEDERNIAQGYLVKYGRLMRKILDHSNELTVPLNEELEALNLYVELEQLRVKQGFDFQIELQEAIDIYTTSVPSMVIQPIMENAIWHGVSKLDEKGEIVLKFKMRDDRIEVIICDNGAGFDQSESAALSNSKGIQLVRERLELLGKSGAEQPALEIASEVGHGTTVTIRFSSELK